MSTTNKQHNRQRDAEAEIWHDYDGHLHAHQQGRHIDCFCIRKLKERTTFNNEAIAATKAAQLADQAWQAQLDHVGIDRYTLAARTYLGLRELYQAKLAADETMRRAWEKTRNGHL